MEVHVLICEAIQSAMTRQDYIEIKLHQFQVMKGFLLGEDVFIPKLGVEIGMCLELKTCDMVI